MNDNKSEEDLRNSVISIYPEEEFFNDELLSQSNKRKNSNDSIEEIQETPEEEKIRKILTKYQPKGNNYIINNHQLTQVVLCRP